MERDIKQKIVTIRKKHSIREQLNCEIRWETVNGLYLDNIQTVYETDKEIIFLLTFKEK